MTAAVSILPTQRAIDAAWDEYAGLVRAMDERPELRVDQAYQIRILRAHKRWSDLFIAADRQS